MGKTYRSNNIIKTEITETNGSKKYFFNDRNNLRALDSLTNFFEEAGLEGCVIGGNAVSANYINFIQEKIKNFDLHEYGKKVKNFSRPTADIDIVINNYKPENFEQLLLKYFGKTGIKAGKNSELDITIDNETPYLSFHFIEENTDSQSEYYREFVKKAKTVSFISNMKKYSCKIADPLDLVIMKLKSCDERVTDAKKKTDLFDLNILLSINKYNISQVIRRIAEIGYDKKYENKIKKSLVSFVNYIFESTDKELAEIKLKTLFNGNIDNLEDSISTCFDLHNV
jgi:hypothetical protein